MEVKCKLSIRNRLRLRNCNIPQQRPNCNEILVYNSLPSNALTVYYISIISIQAFITCASSLTILNQRRWQLLGGQHGKNVDGLFEKVKTVTHPGTNRARRRVTTLIESNTLPLRQAGQSEPS